MKYPLFKQSKKKTKLFGVPLEQLSTPNAGVPYIVSCICTFLQNHGLDQEGLFRVNGNSKIVEKLKAEFEENEAFSVKNNVDVLSMASLLKQFIRELPEPLVPQNMTKSFVMVQQRYGSSRLLFITNIRTLLTSIPAVNLMVLRYLMEFLCRVAEKQSVNKMGATQLGIVFGPNIFRCSEDLAGLQEQGYTNRIVTQMIESYDEIFNDLQGSSAVFMGSRMEDANSASGNGQGRASKANLYVFDDAPRGSLSPSVPPRRSRDRRLSDDNSFNDELDPRFSPILLESDGPSSVVPSPPVTARRPTESVQRIIDQAVSQQLFGADEDEESCRSRSRNLSNRTNLEASGMPEQSKSTGDLLEASVTLANSEFMSSRKKDTFEGFTPSMSSSRSVPINDEGGPRVPPRRKKAAAQRSLPSGRSPDVEERDRDQEHTLTRDTSHDALVAALPASSSSDPISYDTQFSSSDHVQTRLTNADASVQRYPDVGRDEVVPLSQSAAAAQLRKRKPQAGTAVATSAGWITKTGNLKADSVDSGINATSEAQNSPAAIAASDRMQQMQQMSARVGHRITELYDNRQSLKEADDSLKQLLLDMSGIKSDIGQMRRKINSESRSAQRPVDSPVATVQSPSNGPPTVEAILAHLAEKRRDAGRPEDLMLMNPAQIKDEKLALQRALLQYESIHGRPNSKQAKDVMRPLYDRYRQLKRMLRDPNAVHEKQLKLGDFGMDENELARLMGTSGGATAMGEPSSTPLGAGRAASLSIAAGGAPLGSVRQRAPEPRRAAVVPRAEAEIYSDEDADSPAEAEADSADANNNRHKAAGAQVRLTDEQTSELYGLLEVDVATLGMQLTALGDDKKRLRRQLKDFEMEYYRASGQRPNRHAKAAMLHEYKAYKRTKLRLRLLQTALDLKHSALPT